MSLVPYKVNIDYGMWSYRKSREEYPSGSISRLQYFANMELSFFLSFSSQVDVMRSILPEELHGEIPVGFNTAGHVGMYAHEQIVTAKASSYTRILSHQ